jgi:uncharacterized repeat protein (TIGR03803 family)
MKECFMTNLFLSPHRILSSLLLTTILAVAPLAAAQHFTDVYQFKSGPGGSSPYANVILDSNGNLYGTTTLDGAYAYGTVYEVSASGKETVLYSFSGTGGDGANPIAPLVRDAAGNLYGTTTYGGVFGGRCSDGVGCGTVFKITPAGKEIVLHQFTDTGVDARLPWQGLVLDSAGNLYGTAAFGGMYGGGIIFKITPTGKEVVLHSFNPNSGGGGDGFAPYGGSLLGDSAGNLYGTTEGGGAFGAGAVFKLDSKGNETVLYSFTFTGGDGMEPTGTLTRDKDGNLYGATFYGGAFGFGTIFKLDSAGTETILHSFAATAGDGASPGGGLLRDGAGNLYGTTNSGGASFMGTIFKLDPGGNETILHTFSGADGSFPELGMIADSKGNLYGTAQYGGPYGGGAVFKLSK